MLRSAWFGPAVLAAAFIFLMALLLLTVDRGSRQNGQDQLQASGNAARESIRRRLNATREYFQVLAEDYDRQTLDEPWLRKRLSQYVQEHRELLSVVQLSVKGDVAWHDGGGELGSRQRRLGSIAEQAFAQASATGQVAYSAPYQDVDNELAMVMVVPLKRRGQNVGVLVGVYAWDHLLRTTIHRDVLDKYQVSLVDDSGGVLMSLTSGLELDSRLQRVQPLAQPVRGLALKLVPYGAGFWDVPLVLLMLMTTGLVLGMAWGMWSLKRQIADRRQAEAALRQAHDELEQRVRARTADLQQANHQLQQEMTRRRQAEVHARRHQEHLGHVGRVSTMVEMAAGMAHELNQPLGSIASYTEGCVRMIESGSADLAELRSALGEVSQQARRAGEIIHRLRRLVSEGGEAELVRSDLKRLVGQVVNLLLPQMRQAQVHLSLELEKDLPAVMVDAIQIQQVALNLMKNAIEAMSENPPQQHRLLVVQARRVTAPDGQSPLVELSVADTGPGCDAGLINKIFDAFFTTKKGGMGMGLSISRTIIEAHGGKLLVEPNTPRGLVVKFTLKAVEHRPERPELPGSRATIVRTGVIPAARPDTSQAAEADEPAGQPAG